MSALTIVLAVGITVLIIVLLFLVIFCFCCKKKSENVEDEDKERKPRAYLRLDDSPLSLGSFGAEEKKVKPRSGIGSLDFCEQELHVNALFLESLNEVVVTVKEGRNFPTTGSIFIRASVSRQGYSPERNGVVQFADTTTVSGQVYPVWNEHLPFIDIREEDLPQLSIRISAMTWSTEKSGYAEIGFVELATESSHPSGRHQWLRIISKEGIISCWHKLLQPKS